MRTRLIPIACAWLLGCTSMPAPAPTAIEIDTSPCDGDAVTCINAGAVSRDVSGVHVIHKPIHGDPVVALRVLVDGGDRGDL